MKMRSASSGSPSSSTRITARSSSQVRKHLSETHRDNGAEWARDYAHQLLNRIMFLYFIARKGWLLGRDGNADRDFMRHFWEDYRETKAKDAFHRDWLDVLFFEAFNNRWQNRAEYLRRFPGWLVKSLSQAPLPQRRALQPAPQAGRSPEASRAR